MKLFSAVAVVALALSIAPAFAFANRTNVASTGTDSGNCAITAPCRTFAYAIGQTAPNGQIVVLDTAGYGTVMITKAISIINESNVAIVNAPSGDGITINAGTNDAVVLRGLTIDGLSTGTNGIVFNSGAGLTVDKCVEQNFTASGIAFTPSAGSFYFRILDSKFSNNGADGIHYAPPLNSTATAKGIIERTTTAKNQNGIYFANNPANNWGGHAATFSLSYVTSTNNLNGVKIDSDSSFLITTTIDSSFFSNNSGTGVYLASAAGIVILGRSVSASNSQGARNDGGSFYSYRNNEINGNFNDFVGPSTTATMQ